MEFFRKQITYKSVRGDKIEKEKLGPDSRRTD